MTLLFRPATRLSTARKRIGDSPAVLHSTPAVDSPLGRSAVEAGVLARLEPRIELQQLLAQPMYQMYHATTWYKCTVSHLKIAIDIEAPEPPFAQLIAQVKAAVESGRIRPGEALPSIRQLANDLALNLKTVAKAYRLLERDGVIQTRGYRGSFVHPHAAANCSVDMSERAHEKLQETIEELRAAGVTDSEIRNAFNRSMNGSRTS